MEEKIYTIPVTESFEKKDGCPFCRLYRDLDENECNQILGDAMMDSNIRLKTNEVGFCKKHYEKLLTKNNRLSLALMLESHLKQQKDNLSVCKKGLLGNSFSAKNLENVQKLTSSCYICPRIEETLAKMVRVSIMLWNEQADFRRLFEAQPYFCLPHAAMLLESAKNHLDKKRFADFALMLDTVQKTYTESLSQDVSWFCKKFDYRYENEPWGNAKDSVERAAKFLEGDF